MTAHNDTPLRGANARLSQVIMTNVFDLLTHSAFPWYFSIKNLLIYLEKPKNMIKKIVFKRQLSYNNYAWGRSSPGRASRSQRGGSGSESRRLHQVL